MTRPKKTFNWVGKVHLAHLPPTQLIIIIENRETQKFILNKPVNKLLFFEDSSG